MSEDITIVTSANRTSLIKTFSGPDLNVGPSGIGKDLMTSEEAIFEINIFTEVLPRHHSTPNTSFLATQMAKVELAMGWSNKSCTLVQRLHTISWIKVMKFGMVYCKESLPM